ncbi:MAG TPA: molecular chaperone TorD family protein [Desulfurivibrionaceae bacterium]|nr:molecular chaperone TorD family protein [Desulfurivibrionaceae bacterium]
MMQCEQHTMQNDDHTGHLGDIYRFLARSMAFPEDAWLHGAYWQALFALLEGLGWQNEADELRCLTNEDASLLAPLQVEYTRLFINAIPHVVAPPYGSVYLSDDGMLYGNSAVLTKNFYREHGFDLPGEADIPDHLSLELEFLALLAEERHEEEVFLFLRDHFRPWFPAFQARVLAEVRHPFYRVLVNLIDFFTREEWDNGFESDET